MPTTAVDIQSIRNAGVVGAGGAGFPTYVKLQSEADVLIANGAECEPLLRVDQGLMVHQAAAVARGMRLAGEAVGAERIVAGLKAKYEEAIAALEAQGIEVVALPDFYPVGDEHVLVYEITGRVIPQGGLPIETGVVVQNIETLLNVARAVDGKPVVDTYVSVLGEVPEPREMRVPVGMSVRDVIDLAGGPSVHPCAVVEGGPMMGVLVDPDKPVTKTTKGLIVLPENHHLVREKRSDREPSPRSLKITQSACCQCHICTDLCPRHLLGHEIAPDQVVRNLHFAKGDEYVLQSASLCTQCNLCGYFGCPLRLHPMEVHASVKRKMDELGEKPYRPEKKVTEPPSYRGLRRVPSKRLVQRLWLEAYDRPLVWDDTAHRPSRVVIPVQQCIGAAAEPSVAPGDEVARGQKIGDVAGEDLGVPVHASVGGTVEEVGGGMISIVGNA